MPTKIKQVVRDLTKNDPHRLIWNVIIGSMALLEDVCHGGWALSEVSEADARPSF